MQLISKLSSLISLELYWLLSVTDETLMTVAAFTPNLERLSLSGCKNITDQGLRLLAGTCQKLTHLNLTRSGYPLSDLMQIRTDEMLERSEPIFSQSHPYKISQISCERQSC